MTGAQGTDVIPVCGDDREGRDVWASHSYLLPLGLQAQVWLSASDIPQKEQVQLSAWGPLREGFPTPGLEGRSPIAIPSVGFGSILGTQSFGEPLGPLGRPRQSRSVHCWWVLPNCYASGPICPNRFVCVTLSRERGKEQPGDSGKETWWSPRQGHG